jgi:hypothetical protein
MHSHTSPMDIGEFCDKVSRLGMKYSGSVTSWGRTVQHSVAVGGFASDPHTWWLGADMVYDHGANAALDADAAALGLRVIHEKTHDHFQPADWVNKEHP